MNTNSKKNNIKNNNSSVFTVNAKTARYIEMLQKLIKTQKDVMEFLLEDGAEEAANTVAEPIGNSVKALGAFICAHIYDRIIEGDTDI